MKRISYINSVTLFRADKTIYLNGHTIDKNLYDPDKGIDIPKDNGCIFYHSGNSTFAVAFGTLKGANNNGNGGAVYSNGCEGSISLTDLTITSNKAQKGSAIYYVGTQSGELFIAGVTSITGNYCSTPRGGAILAINSQRIQLCDEITISDNKGIDSYGNDLCLFNASLHGERFRHLYNHNIKLYVCTPNDMGIHDADNRDELVFNNLPTDEHDTVISGINAEKGTLQSNGNGEFGSDTDSIYYVRD